MNAKRGFVPDDVRNFSDRVIPVLKKASRHIAYLINEGYSLKSASTFVGNHFLLSERQRLAIARSVATKKQLADRKNKCKSLKDIGNQIVWIDGFNQIITLEVMLNHSPLFYGMDTAVRDLAGLRGTYKMIEETDQAITMMFDTLKSVHVRRAEILLDKPVSNSGRLKMKIAEIGESYPFEINIEIIKDVDKTLYGKDNVVTSDGIILDQCHSWFNMVEHCLAKANVSPLKVW